jgi:hypothetical protein
MVVGFEAIVSRSRVNIHRGYAPVLTFVWSILDPQIVP